MTSRVGGAEDRLVGLVALSVDEGIERGKYLVDGERLDVRTCGRLRSDPWSAGPGLPWRP